MALSDNERKSLGDQITAEVRSSVGAAMTEVIDIFRPHGWRRVTFFLREWGLAGTAIAVPVTLFGLVIAVGAIAFIQFHAATARIANETTFEAKTTDTLNGINDHLKKIDNALSLIQIQQAASDPTDKDGALEAKKAIEAARVNSVQLPPDLILQAGAKFVRGSFQNPSAWDAAVAFLNYRSYSVAVTQTFPSPQGALETPAFSLMVPPTEHPPYISEKGATPEEAAARIYPIGENPNKAAETGVEYYFAKGGGMVLDKMELKNVVFTGVHIVYGGGPVHLNHVFFVNCTFEMPRVDNTRNFALALLAPEPSTTFFGE
jgi:hypothetical protein